MQSFLGVAQLIGKHSLIIRPAHFVWIDGGIVIDKTDIIIPNFKERCVDYYTLDHLCLDELSGLLDMSSFPIVHPY